ncbi:MAG: hypothetical protein JWL83_1256 [Actinomycetia bacterium]|nr:hypothetical protein [Actinomycetes bacterium]
MRFSIDPWDPGYGGALDPEMPPSDAKVVVDVELPPAEWQPIHPPVPTIAPDAVVFVDGVRRIDARTWVHVGPGRSEPGIFASYAAGAVRCDGSAQLVDACVGRLLAAPVADAAAVTTRHATFEPVEARDASPASLMYAVHEVMAEAEVLVAERTRRATDELLLLDGPLRKRGHIPDAVGLIKSHYVRYLGDTALNTVVDRLLPGERTPIFRIEAQPFARASWYLRLPGAADAPWAGILRCEASGALPIEQLSALADRVTVMLPRFASQPHKDARAPQNLYPIAGLERELRRRMGDTRLLYRALRAAAATAA